MLTSRTVTFVKISSNSSFMVGLSANIRCVLTLNSKGPLWQRSIFTGLEQQCYVNNCWNTNRICLLEKYMKKINHSLVKEAFFIPIVTSLVLRLLIGCSWKQMPSISQYCTRPTITYLSNSSWLKNPTVWLSRCLSCIYSLVCTIIRRETGQNTTSMSTGESPRHQRVGLAHITVGAVQAGQKSLCSKELHSSETEQKGEQNKEIQEIVRHHKLTRSTNILVTLRDQQGFLVFKVTQTTQLTCSLSYTWKIHLLLQHSEPATPPKTTAQTYFHQFLPKFIVYPKALWSLPHLWHLCPPTARGGCWKPDGSIRWNAEVIKKLGNWLKSTMTD